MRKLMVFNEYDFVMIIGGRNFYFYGGINLAVF